MYYTSKITEPEQALEVIANAAGRFNPNIFLYALEYKNYDKPALKRMCREISEYSTKMEAELDRLQKFAKPFNESFVTDQNKCYDVALRVLRKIRSGIKETKRIYLKFCPRARKDKLISIHGNNPVSAFEYSRLSIKAEQLDAFGLEEWPKVVQNLYSEMEKFFLLLTRSIKLCKQVIEDERTIRKDPAYCQYLYEKFKEKFLKKIANVIMMIPHDSEFLSEKNNPAIAARKHFGSDEAFAQHAFHNYHVKEMECYVLKETFDSEEHGNMTQMEKLLFRNKPTLCETVRYLIAHFDTLMPDSWNRKKLSAKHVAMLMLWCGIPKGNEEQFVQYFNVQYKQDKAHKYETIGNSAVNGQKRNIKTTSQEYKNFANEIKHMLSTNIKFSEVSGKQ